MTRLVGFLIALTFLVAIEASAVSFSFSYEFAIDGRKVIVSGLANGKSFVKLDGKIQTPENGVFRIKTDKTDIVVMQVGKIVYIGNDELSITLASPVGKIDRRNPIKIGTKTAYRTSGGFVTDDEPLWNFHYYLKSGKVVLDVLAITNQKDGNQLPKLFQELVRTLKPREVQP